jgi:hypothetical protein
MWPALRHGIAAAVGGATGYLCLTILANLEDWQFYTLRSLVTGKSAMYEIVDHPADAWVVPVLLVLFIFTGAASGVLVAGRFRPRV